MRVRHLVTDHKWVDSDTGWSSNDLPPRHAPIYPKSRPIRAGWRWRSARLDSADESYVLLVLCNAGRDNWQAILIRNLSNGASVVSRYEYHGSHPGTHAHFNCSRSGIEVGATSLDHLSRSPRAGQVHRRLNGWTEQTFWEAAKQFFRVTENDGPLFTHAS